MMKVGLDFMGPFTFSTLRFSVGTLVMFGIVFWKRLPRPRGEEWIHLIFLGLLQTTFVFAFVMYGMQFVNAGKSSILLYSMPIWSMVLAWIFLNEAVTVRKLASILFGTAGLLFIIGWDMFMKQNLQTIIGEVLIVIGAFSWGAANVLLKKKFREHNKLQISAWQMFFGTLGLIVAMMLTEWGEPVHITPMSVFAVLFSGVLASAFSFTAWFVVVSKIDTTVASVSLLFVPVFAIILSWIQLNETLDLGIMIGTILISTGVYLATVQKKRKTTIEKKTVAGNS